MHQQVEAELRPVLLAKIREEEKELLKIEAEAELRPVRISGTSLLPFPQVLARFQLENALRLGSWIMNKHLLKQPQGFKS